MSTEQVITQGRWTFTKSGTWACWTVTDSVSDETYDTETSVFTDARRIAFDRSRRASRPTAPATYTVASGPQRARAGHQRLPRTNHFE